MTESLLFVGNHEMASLEANSWYADSSSANAMLLKMVAPSLVEIGPDLTAEPSLAEEWTTSSDSKRFRFKLRSGVTLHDGSVLDPNLVVWNFHRLVDQRVNSPSGWDFRNLEHVVASGNDAVEFEFRHPWPSFPLHLPWSAHIVADSLIQPIGAGPYRVVEWKRGSHLELVRHDSYFRNGAVPAAERIRVEFAPDTAARTRVIEEGRADMVEGVPGGAIDTFQSRNLLEIRTIRASRQMLIAFNCKDGPCSDVRIRRAVAHAIDRDSIREAIWGQGAQRLEGQYPKDDPWHTELPPYEYDPQAARRLLKEAGVDALKIPRAISTAVSPTTKIAAMVGDYLREIGIEISVTAYDDPPWWPAVYRESNWDMAFQNYPPRPHPDTLFQRDFSTDGPLNGTHYANPELDRLLESASKQASYDDQKEHFDQAQRIVHRDLPVLPIAAPDIVSGSRPNVVGYAPHPCQYVDFENVHTI